MVLDLLGKMGGIRDISGMRRGHAAALAMELLTLIEPLSLITTCCCIFLLSTKYCVYKLYTVDAPKVTAR